MAPPGPSPWMIKYEVIPKIGALLKERDVPHAKKVSISQFMAHFVQMPFAKQKSEAQNILAYLRALPSHKEVGKMVEASVKKTEGKTYGTSPWIAKYNVLPKIANLLKEDRVIPTNTKTVATNFLKNWKSMPHAQQDSQGKSLLTKLRACPIVRTPVSPKIKPPTVKPAIAVKPAVKPTKKVMTADKVKKQMQKRVEEALKKAKAQRAKKPVPSEKNLVKEASKSVQKAQAKYTEASQEATAFEKEKAAETEAILQAMGAKTPVEEAVEGWTPIEMAALAGVSLVTVGVVAWIIIKKK